MTTEIKPRKVLSLKKKEHLSDDNTINEPVISRKKTVFIPQQKPVEEKPTVLFDKPYKSPKSDKPQKWPQGKGPNGRNFKPNSYFKEDDLDFWNTLTMSKRMLRLILVHFADDKGYTNIDRSALFSAIFGKNVGWVKKRLLKSEWNLPDYSELTSRERFYASNRDIGYYAYHIACAWHASSCNNREDLPFMKKFKQPSDIYAPNENNSYLLDQSPGYKHLQKLATQLQKGRNKKEQENDI